MNRKLTLWLDPATLAVLNGYARSRHMALEDAIYCMLYRDAAAMTGWPGQLGLDLTQALMGAVLPDAAADALEED